MHFKRKPQGLSAKIDLTALIDILFVLLVFFLLNSNFSTPVGIKIELPKAKMSSRMALEHTEININSLNQIIYKGSTYSLRNLKKILLTLNNKIPIILRADEDASYGTAIKVFDLLRELKFKKVTLGTKKSEL